MRTIQRQIVGGFIFSSDGKMLLGRNGKGGVHEGFLVVPGGGVEPGETELEALRREMLEEVHIDVNEGTVKKFNVSEGQAEKTLRDTGERVLVDMTFNDYHVLLPKMASDVLLKPGDNFTAAGWFAYEELETLTIVATTRASLEKLHLS